MISKKKKIIVLSVMVCLLVVTAYLNIALNNAAVNTGSENVTSQNYFTTYRTDRQSTRNEEILFYDAIIADANASTDAKTSAEEKKAELLEKMDMELVTEGLIKAKGFEDVIVTSSLNNINVIVKCDNLDKVGVAQIVSIVKEQTDASIENIFVIPIN